jgi:hypothetical protein
VFYTVVLTIWHLRVVYRPIGRSLKIDMKSKADQQQHGLEAPTKLVPAGSVNRVLLLGGKNLTVLQSLGLMFIGLCVAGIGGSLVHASGGQLDAIYFLVAGVLLVLWGLAMFLNGVLGVTRRLRKVR